MNSEFDVVARMTAAWEIETLICRFALLNDAGDADALAALFTLDGSFARPSEPERPARGREAIAAHFRDRPKRLTRHLVSNIVVDIEGPTAAKAQSYLVLYTAPIGSTTPAIADPIQLIGGFNDRLVREEGEWRFAERRGSLTLRITPPGA